MTDITNARYRWAYPGDPDLSRAAPGQIGGASPARRKARRFDNVDALGLWAFVAFDNCNIDDGVTLPQSQGMLIFG